MGETADMHIDEEDVCAGLPCSTLEELVIELLELDELRISLDEDSIERDLSMMFVALIELSPQEYNRSAVSQRRQSFLIIKSLLQ